jgi:NADH-quinone oxidoreductase subunit M
MTPTPRHRTSPVRLIVILFVLSAIGAFLPHDYLLVGMLLLPLLGVVVGMLLPQRIRGKTWGLAVSASTLVTAVSMAIQYDWAAGGYQFVLKGPRIEALGAQFALGVDPISLALVLLTAFLHPIAVTASLRSVHTRSREHYANLNLLLVFMLGTFMATDLLLFYVFFEASLVPLFFIVGIWGGKERRRAAVTLFLYTFSASVFALAGIVYVGLRAGTFDIQSVVTFAQNRMTETERFWVLMSLLAAFAVKTPLFPLHTWLPLAHTEAPTAGSVDLAALVLKLGTYGLIRIALPIGLITRDGGVLFPKVLTFLAILCLIGVVYAALIAWVQTDIKKLVAYSSVSHLGLCVIGMLALNTHGMAGSVLYMINHGIVSGALFLIVGMIYNRYHSRDIRDLSGLAKAMPRMAFFLVLFTMAAVGLPGTNGFVSEFLTILGAFTSPHLGVTFGLIAATGIVLSAIYMLHLAGTILFGPLHYPLLPEEGDTHQTVHPKYVSGGDITGREVLVLTPLAVAVIVLGVFPTPLLRSFERPVDAIRHAKGATNAPAPAAVVTAEPARAAAAAAN